MRLKRMVRALDVIRAEDLEAKRSALREDGIVVNRHRANGQVVLTAVIDGKRRTLRSEPDFGLRPSAGRSDSPDGGFSARLLDGLDELEAEAEEAEAIDTAYAYSLESEWSAIESDLEQIVSGGEELTCLSGAAESPDGSTMSAPVTTAEDDCWAHAFAALGGARDVIREVWGKITANTANLNVLKGIIGGLRDQVGTGALTAAAAIEAAAPLVAEFIAGLNIGWVGVGLGIAATGYFFHEYGECMGWWPI